MPVSKEQNTENQTTLNQDSNHFDQGALVGLNPAGVTMVNDLFKDTKPFMQVLALLLALVFFLLLASVLQMLLLGMGSEVGNAEVQRNIQLLSQLLTFFCPSLLFAIFFGGRPVEFLKMGRSSGLSVATVGVGLLFFFLLAPLVSGLTLWNSQWHLPQPMAELEILFRKMAEESSLLVERMLMLSGTKNFIANLLILAFLPAFCEECFFRGALQQSLLRWLRNPHAAVVVSAAFFSLMHGDFFAFVPRFVMGVALGYLFYYSGSIWVSMAAHFANNAVVVVAYALYAEGRLASNPADPTLLPIWLMALGTLLASALFYHYFCRKKAKMVAS